MLENKGKKDRTKKMTKKRKSSEEQKEEYVPGSVASLLGSGNLTKNPKSASGGDGNLSSFFKPSVVKQATITSPSQIRSLSSKSTLEARSEAGQSLEQENETGTHSKAAVGAKRNSKAEEAVRQKTPSAVKRSREEADEGEFEPRTKRQHGESRTQETQDPLVLARTVFVGNLPISITKRELKGLFKTYGTIESIRFRSMGVADPSVSKKVAAIKQELNPKKQSFNAYIVYEDQQCAQAALKSNGKVVNKHHMRVDIAGNNKEHDMKRSLFVGNLPFDLADEDLRNHFEKFGTVEGIRIIRDKATGVGKGFGYVLFQDSTSVPYAIKMDGSKLKGRNIRVKRAVKKEKRREQRDYSAGRGNSAARRGGNSAARRGGMSAARRGGNSTTRRGGKSARGSGGGFSQRRDKLAGKAAGNFQGRKGGGRPQSKGKKKPRKGGKR